MTIGDRLRRSPGLVLFLVLAPLGIATAYGLVALWPTGELPETGIVNVGAQFRAATIVSATADECAGTNEDRRPDGTIPGAVQCALVVARVTEGAEAGLEVEVWSPPTVPVGELGVGTPIVLVNYPATETDTEVWAWQDFSRTLPLGVAFAVIGFFMLPALLEGQNPGLVGLVGSSAIMFVVLYLAHGLSHRTTTALLGTIVGLALTAGLGAVAARMAHLDGITGEDTYQLALVTGHLGEGGLRGIFLAGVILAGLGVLNDVTITQASAVWELREADPTASRRSLFSSGMRIGRDHIASTVYTMAFAYAGAALPVLLLLEVWQRPLIPTITSGVFAEEIARTAVGSIGLVLAIPLTTIIAVLVATAKPVRRRRHLEPQPGHAHAHVHGA